MSVQGDPYSLKTVHKLKKNDHVELENGNIAVVSSDSPLGEGGQGVVYPVEYMGGQYALKWINNPKYFAKTNPPYHDNLRKLSENKELKNQVGGNIALPMVLTKVCNNGQFGYLMEMISDENVVSLQSILAGRNTFTEFDTLLLSLINLIKILERLRQFDLMMADINGSNILFNTKTGDAKICDCDCIVPINNTFMTIGAIDYVAPEVVAEGKQSVYSEYYSLAIVLFRLLFRYDPMVIPASSDETVIDDEITHRKNPSFIFSEGSSNTIPSDVVDNWERTPNCIKESFIRTFVKGSSDIQSRASFPEWMGSLMMWRDDCRTDPFMPLCPPIPRRKQIVIVVVDTSSSMKSSMEDINMMLTNLIRQLKEKEGDYSTGVEIGIITYGGTCQWSNPPSNVRTVTLKSIECSNDSGRFDSLCVFLNKEMAFGRLFNKDELIRRPLIILVSNGLTDIDYMKDLTQLKNNPLFRKSIKIAMKPGDVTGQFLLQQFTEDGGLIIDRSDIKKKVDELIYNITLTFTQSFDSRSEEITKIIEVMSSLKRD